MGPVRLVDYKRQLLLFDPKRHQAHVTIVGLGNIGSHTALTLVRLGVTRFTLYDHDHVEAHNLSSQAYDVNDLGKSKVQALATKMTAMNPEVRVQQFNKKYIDDDVYGILVIAVDTMKGRKKICEALEKVENKPQLIIDARVGGNQLEIYTSKTPAEWKTTLLDKAAEAPCGGRFICYTSVVTGALITNQIKKYLRNEKMDRSMMVHVDSLQVVKNYDL